MRWIAISGSWRVSNKNVENDVRREVSNIIGDGNGIVSGGALNVDYFATDEAMKLNPGFDHIKIFIPTTLEIYASHYRQRASEGVITSKQAEDLIEQLSKISKVNSNSLIENMQNNIVDKNTYFKRNSEVINAADELLAFHVNDSEGVNDTIKKAEEKDIPIRIFNYQI